MKKKFYVVFAAVLLCVLFWCISFIRCEILILQHEQEFTALYKNTNMIDHVDYLKVIKYSEDNACGYYVTNNEFGNVLTFDKHNGE